MNQNQIELLIKLLIPKSELIVNQIKAELRTLAQNELSVTQLVVIDNAIKGALITGMKTTVERVLSK